MQKLTITGITKGSPQQITWSGMPTSLLLIRNRSFDSGVSIVQTLATSTGATKVVTTPIKRNEEHSFYITDSTLPFEIHTTTEYTNTNSPNCLCAIVLNNANHTQGTTPIWVVNIVEEQALINNFTMHNKVSAYFDAVESNVNRERFEQNKYPKLKDLTDTRLIQRTNYHASIAAGRGFLLNTLSGLVQTGVEGTKPVDNIFSQTIFKVTHNQQYAGQTTNIDIDTTEVPYLVRYDKDQILAFDAQLKKKLSYIEYPHVMGQAMFQIQASKENNVSVLNNKTYSGLTAIGTTRSSQEPATQVYAEDPDGGYVGDDSSIYETRMWRVTDKSQSQWWQDRFTPETPKWLAFTLKTTSTDYPYTIAFTAPLLGGITFLSNTMVKVHLGNREVTYNDVNHYGNTNRYVINYEADSLQLYVNGQLKSRLSQSSSSYTDAETNTFGLDVKESYTHKHTALNLVIPTIGTETNLTITASTPTVTASDDLVEVNQYTIRYLKLNTTTPAVTILPKMTNTTGRNKGIVPLGAVTNNGNRELSTSGMFLWETASSGVSTMALSSTTKESKVYAIAAEDTSPTIDVVETSAKDLVSVSFLKEKSMDLYKNLKHASQDPLFRYAFAVSTKSGTGTAKVRVSWVTDAGTQTKDINVTVA